MTDWLYMKQADHQGQKQRLQATTMFDSLLSLQASQAQNSTLHS